MPDGDLNCFSKGRRWRDILRKFQRPGWGEIKKPAAVSFSAQGKNLKGSNELSKPFLLLVEKRSHMFSTSPFTSSAVSIN